jgi:hypothetical protein
LTTPAGAGGGIKLSSSFKLGSLIADGIATGLGKTDWVLKLDGVGHAAVICTNNGSNDVPGQSSPHVDGTGTQSLPGDSQLRKNGKSPFSVEALPDAEANPTEFDWVAGGCPNSNWTARVDFVYWDYAKITVYSPLDTSFSSPVATYEYQCVTTRTGPAGDPDSTFDDGTVACTQTFPTK